MLDPNKVKLAIAPIGWTNDDMPDLGAENTFEQCISEMALAGFKGSEIGNKYPQDPDVLKKYLDIRGLQICNAWFSSYLTSKPYEETIEAFKAHCDKLYKLQQEYHDLQESRDLVKRRRPVLQRRKLGLAHFRFSGGGSRGATHPAVRRAR